MAAGGARKGSGRPKGALTKKTRKIAEKAMNDGITPLEVMLRAMRIHAQAERWDDAAGVAKDAAPYMHPRLTAASLEHKGGITVKIVNF